MISIYLHSTMLLLYRSWNTCLQKFCLNLHSTMLLLYLLSSVLQSCFQAPFTFHYASTLSKIRNDAGLSKAYLHSTMLLLYLLCQSARACRLMIYIPLCFYFINNLPAGTVPSQPDLHSTMLLLYLHQIITNAKVNTFTFHYASTLSQNPNIQAGPST